LITILVAIGSLQDQSPPENKTAGEAAMIIMSSAFQDGGMIPSKYTCDGQDISPPLSWSGVPYNAKSLALISDDPDAPMGTWVHWVVYNIPPNETSFEEGITKDSLAQKGILQGTTDFRRQEYGGPCPPSGTHRYYFKLYALGTELNPEKGANKKQVEAAMEGQVLMQGQLMGRYSRRR
jgi:Raf kinase inhibitor-like YbhB/YbcL family protein